MSATSNPELDGLARMAYPQYLAATGGRNDYDWAMPDFDGLHEIIRNAWRAAAGAVARAVTVPTDSDRR